MIPTFNSRWAWLSQRVKIAAERSFREIGLAREGDHSFPVPSGRAGCQPRLYTVLTAWGVRARVRCHWALNTCIVGERLISDVNAGVTRVVFIYLFTYFCGDDGELDYMKYSRANNMEL